MPWNPSSGDKDFPGYSPGARVLDLGNEVLRHSYYVKDETLLMDAYDPEDGSMIVPPVELVYGVLGLRALCLPKAAEGDPPCSDRTTAVRFGIVVKSAVRDTYEVSDTVEYWPGETQELEGEQRYYRYRTFNTIVPFKNVLWNVK